MYLSSYNLGRSGLATGTLLTLLFNSNYTLFGNEIKHFNNNFIYDFNFYYLLSNNLIIAKILSVIILIIVILGYFPRFTGVLHWYITFSFFLSCDVIDGGDHIASNLTLLILPITLMDNRKNHWQIENEKNKFQLAIRNLFILLISIQVCAIYLHAFVGKLFVDEWVNGTAIYYWFTHNHFGVSPSLLPITKLILSNNLVVTLITWGTLLLEFFLSACILLNKKDKNRYLFFLLGIFFHLSIVFIHGLISFYFTMASALILYLIPSNLAVNFKTFKFNNIWTKILKQ
jgi:antimicrobial peptide system SdpB family protein